MTKEEGELYITLATLHGPSTREEVAHEQEDPEHDPLTHTKSGWWVWRDVACQPTFYTREEAARHYCLHYGLIKP